MNSKQKWQNAGLIILTAVLAIGIIWMNVFQRSVKYYKEGEIYFSEGKYLEAITSYETSAHAYTPLNKYVRQSMERLWEIGNLLENEKKDTMGALIAYRCLRSSVYAIRSLYMPYKDWIPQCDERIAAIVEAQRTQQINENNQ